MNRILRNTLTSVLLGVLLSGCGSNVTLQAPDMPTPLIDPIPASIGLRMPAEFDHFVHEEEIIGREKWSIDMGDANAALFKQLFGYMFEEVTLLGAEDNVVNFPIDALVEPTIDAFEFSVPSQSKTDAFAVWIRYRIKVFDHEGDEVANWPVSAYGKSPKASFTGAKALQRAAVLAMRDAAALMIMKLDEATGISRIAEARVTMGEAAPAAAAEPPPSTEEVDETTEESEDEED